MAELKLALPTIFLHEGRYVDSKSDPGGATNFGISLRFLMTTGDLDLDGWRDGDINKDGKINAEDIRLLTKEKAVEIYDLYFWRPNHYDQIEDQKIATKIFDFAINMGSFAANKIAQRAVRAAVGVKLIEDGEIGLKTLSAFNMCKPELLMVALKSEGAGYYRNIRYNGSKDFVTGWLNRAYSSPQ